MTLHVHTARFQPATRYRVDLSSWERGFFKEDGFWVRCSPRTPTLCFKCRKFRWAKNMVVQVYFDGVYQWCKPGKGCKAK